MRAGILLMFWMLCSADTWADDQRLQFLHEIRTRSYLLCSSAMLYFNPAIKSPDPRALASNYDSLMRLHTRTVQLGQPSHMVEIQRSMQGLMKSLERMPRQDAGLYPEKLMHLLELQRQAESWADEQYRQQSGARFERARELHQQSLAMSHMLLNYQIRSYPLAAGSSVGMSDTQLEAQDSAINERFVQLIKRHEEFAKSFEAIHKNYRFVRGQLLSKSVHQPSGGIEFYLTRSIIDMDELAIQILESQKLDGSQVL
ncbi:hypothetical protein LJR071_001603 [Pseudomonas sp. LjRoot71]|uniref:hypothetical protein n=1 Tax=unclassified Pseudomonas TaxID=196821 RepID=UPI0025E9E305|nr:hypothetical protein [Pseudomonas sp. UBA7530]